LKRMKSVLKVGLVLALALTLPGCTVFRSSSASCHKKQPYMAASSVQQLKIPPGLDVPDTTNALRIPDLKEPAPPSRKGKQPCLDEPPPYKVAKPVPPQA
jgi:uncharacterized lipoprotein